MDFLYSKGAEILTETARFWASRCEYNKEQDRYEINQVTGPDEWHEPVNNNLYTNYLARWNLGYVLSLLASIKKENQEAYDILIEKDRTYRGGNCTLERSAGKDVSAKKRRHKTSGTV